MTAADKPEYRSFDQITGRLDEIVSLVRSKDVSLERSLDLFDEALSLGAQAVEMVDSTNFTPEEEARLKALGSSGVLEEDPTHHESDGDVDGATSQA